MNYFGRLVNGIKGYYSEINSATLTGAIDIIVVRQADGSFVGSPFHVRFGKIGVLRSREKVVDISINDEPVDLHMKLGEGGEAFFVEPCASEDVPLHLCTSPIPDVESLMSKGIAKLKRQIKETEQQSFDSDNQDNSFPNKIDSSKSLKLDSDNDNESFCESDAKQNDATLESEEQGSLIVKRSANISVPGKRSNYKTHQVLNEFYPFSDLDSPLNTPEQQSPINTQPPSPQRYSSDTEVNYQSGKENMKNTATEQATWNWGRLPQGLESSTTERKPISELKKETKKSKTKSFVKTKTTKDIGEGMYLDELLSLDEEVANLYLQQTARSDKETSTANKQATNHRNTMQTSKSESQIHKIDKSNSKRKDENAKTTVECIKSDSELSNSYERSSEFECGKNGVKNDVIDGIKSDSEVSRSDAESGLGSSVSVSPDESKLDEQHDQYSDISLSLCGDIRRGKVSLERFMESSVSFEDFAKEPTQILSNPKLVVRIDDRYYNSSVAVPMLISFMVYQRPLPKITVDALVKEHMPKKSKRRGYASWFSSWRSPPEHNESTDEDVQDGDRSKWQTESLDETDSLPRDETPEPLQEIPENGAEMELSVSSTDTMTTETYKKVLELSSDQLASLNLKDGANEVTFSVTTKYQGTASCSASIFLYNYNDKIIISDIDGTITKSDVLGQILPASFWAQSGVAKLFSSIQKNSYKFMYLSARPIGQAELTRQHLRSVVQENLGLPNGPLFLSPSSLIKAFHREVIEKKPEDFKIPCLRNIRKLFPEKNEPFFAGFGNRTNDVLSYRAVGIPVQRVFTINHKGEVKNEFTNAFQSSYTEMQDLVDQMFPPYLEETTSLVASDEFSAFTFWRTPLTIVNEDKALERTDSALVAKAST
ncbi:phosphatidate phosphatase LPIN2-like [Dendronephthya gigantea]|uniref:phosphatidate phosphatase LPIN2-like n=1 Tax=Dendronephthya gigantea TaxID=151771 RepID=UPI001069FC59|nr:phosphatidate phosphatase LPIN2-like [Dendronephthya gigantea]